MLGLQAALPPGHKVEWPSFGSVEFSKVSASKALQMLRDSSEAGMQFAVFDMEGLVGPLHIRAAGIGLRITPYGSGGTRKVRDVLAEAGVPRYQRANWPVVMDANGRALWLPGIRSAAHAALGETSRTAALLYTTASPAQGRTFTALKDQVS
jgi:tRNA(Ile)-lysidine synthetase-like protein